MAPEVVTWWTWNVFFAHLRTLWQDLYDLESLYPSNEIRTVSFPVHHSRMHGRYRRRMRHEVPDRRVPVEQTRHLSVRYDSLKGRVEASYYHLEGYLKTERSPS